MKTISRIQYERGDHVMLLRGYNKGMIGTVVSHDLDEDDVEVTLANGSADDNEDDWSSSSYSSMGVKYITKAEYEQGLVDNKILRVKGLAVAIQYKRSNFMIGDNVVTPAEAKKIAEFITTNSKTTRKKK